MHPQICGRCTRKSAVGAGVLRGYRNGAGSLPATGDGGLELGLGLGKGVRCCDGPIGGPSEPDEADACPLGGPHAFEVGPPRLILVLGPCPQAADGVVGSEGGAEVGVVDDSPGVVESGGPVHGQVFEHQQEPP